MVGLDRLHEEKSVGLDRIDSRIRWSLSEEIGEPHHSFRLVLLRWEKVKGENLPNLKRNSFFALGFVQ
jgi:hypothetical protein